MNLPSTMCLLVNSSGRTFNALSVGTDAVRSGSGKTSIVQFNKLYDNWNSITIVIHHYRCQILLDATSNGIFSTLYTAQKSHYAPRNHHASHFQKKMPYFQVITTSVDGPSLAGARAMIKVSGHQYWWLAGGYDMETGHF